MATSHNNQNQQNNPKANQDQNASQASVNASHTPMGKDRRPMQDGDTKVQNPSRNVSQNGNNSPNRRQ